MSARRDASPGIAVAALCLVQFVDVMGVTVVVTALPRMLADLGAPDSSGVLVATGYAMFFGGLLMLGARLGDRFGHRRTIMVSLAVFAVGAVLAAVATSIVLLTVARCVQGAAAAASVPSALRPLTTLTADGAAATAGDRRLERGRRGGGRKRVRRRWRRHRIDRLAGHLLGLPAARGSAGGCCRPLGTARPAGRC